MTVPGRWQSVDVQHAEHRFLCALCMEDFFMDESKMCKKWKIKGPLPSEAEGGVRRSVFWSHMRMFRNDPQRVCLLEQDVLRFLGFANTAELLRSFGKSNRRVRQAVFQHLVLSTRWL